MTNPNPPEVLAGGVLIVEDSDTVRHLIVERLQADPLFIGIPIHEAGSILDLRRLGKIRPAVILTDLVLPDSREEATVSTLQKRYPRVPVLVMSGLYLDPTLRRTLIDAHVAGFIDKASIGNTALGSWLFEVALAWRQHGPPQP